MTNVISVLHYVKYFLHFVKNFFRSPGFTFFAVVGISYCCYKTDDEYLHTDIVWCYNAHGIHLFYRLVGTPTDKKETTNKAGKKADEKFFK